MTPSLFVTIIMICLLSVIVIGIIFLNRKRITCMTGMMASMVLGMLVGLSGGVILGIVYSGHLFLATTLSMGIGLAAGVLVGLPVSIMAVLDGALSGMMGGMMGAMLGEMVIVDYSDSLIKIMFIIFVGLILILLYMLSGELKRRESRWLSFFENPFIVLIVLILFFYGYQQLGPSIKLLDAKPISPDADTHQMYMTD